MKVISKIDTPNQLTKGKSYQVITKSEMHKLFFIFNDSGTKAWYSQENLLSLQEHREEKLNKILEDESNI